jgi:hypothetical protein
MSIGEWLSRLFRGSSSPRAGATSTPDDERSSDFLATLFGGESDRRRAPAAPTLPARGFQTLLSPGLRIDPTIGTKTALGRARRHEPWQPTQWRTITFETEQPPALDVPRSLILRDCARLTDLGGLLPVPQALRILNCPRLRELPSRPFVGTDLAIIGSPALRALPDGLTINGDLLLENCSSLESLPNGLTVRGSLRIRGCSRLTHIPSDLVVEQDLVLIGRCRVRELSPAVTLGGSVVLKHVAPALGERRHFQGSLVLIAIPHLTALPADLHVEGDLIIRRCPKLTALPAALRVEGGLEWRRSPAVELPGDMTVGDFVDLEAAPALETLPPRLTVPSWLRLRDCRRLRDLPSGLNVGNGSNPILSFTRWGYSMVGPEPEVGRRRLLARGIIDLAGCERLTTLPEDLRATALELAGTAIRTIPATLESLNLLWRGVRVPARVVVAPESYTPEEVLQLENVEVRRVLIERLGLPRFIALLRPTVLDEDTDSGGPRQLLTFRIRGEREPYVVLSCRCPSTDRTYLLRVAPTIRTCHAAAAWMAGFDDPGAYRPVLET